MREHWLGQAREDRARYDEVADLVELTRSTDSRVRLPAIASLGALEPRADIERRLRELAVDADAPTRRALVGALSAQLDRVEPSPTANELLAALRSDVDARVRRRADRAWLRVRPTPRAA